MKKIAIDCTIKGSGGSSTYYKNLINELALIEEKHQEVSFVFLVNKGLVHLFSDKVISKAILIDESKLSGYKRYFWLYKNLKKIKAQHNLSLLLVPYQLSVGFNILPQVLMLRNMEPFGYKKYNYGIRERLRNMILEICSTYSLKKAHKIIAVSSFVNNFLVTQKKIPKEKIYKIHHGIEKDYDFIATDKYKEVLKEKNINTSFILTSGSFRPYRRFEDIIKAFEIFKSQLSPENKKIKLILVGKGLDKYVEKIKNKILQSDYKEDILYLGFVNKEVMVSLYKRCNFYVASTEIEACPNIAIESLKCGCPVISAQTSPLKEIYGDNALFYEQRNVQELSQQMLKLVDSNKLKQELSKKALVRSQYFSWEKCALETYRFLVKSVMKE